MANNNQAVEQPEKSVSDSALVGRQSIYDRDLNVIAYELLYRTEEQTSQAPAKFDGNVATTKVMLNTFLEIGLDNIVNGKIAFINLTEDFLLGEFEIPVFGHKVVMEVLEDVKPSAEVIQGIKSLKEKGFDIALDDFSFQEEFMPLIEHADLIKVDITLLDKAALEGHVSKIKQEREIKLLAEKIETQEEYDFCKSLGFDFFQGYFLEKPHIVKGQKLPANKLAILQLLTKLQNPDVEIDELEKLIVNDASLSFKLIRYVNSPAYNTGQNITSIKQVLMLLGLNNLRQWVTLIALSGIDDKPSDLIRISLVRAKMCENIAEIAKQKSPQEFFLLGLFSLLDAMLDQPLAQILKAIPIKQELKNALLKHEGMRGNILQCVIAYEHGDIANLKCGKIKTSLMRKIYLESLEWVEAALSGLAK